jgi:aminopeptidase N
VSPAAAASRRSQRRARATLSVGVLTLLGLAALRSIAAPEERNVLPGNVVPTHYDLAITPDVAHLRFDGSVTVSLDVLQATQSIVLNAAELQFTAVRVADRSDVPQVAYDAARQTATLSFATPLAAGRHALTIAYTGRINSNAAGLFALDYGARGARKQALFTQFENSDARRFLPCWDEPARKATFALTATVPANEMAVSNMPVAATERLPHGLKRVHFLTSPKMSSYLLFFAAGDFQRISKTVDGVELGVVVKRGDIGKAHFALDAAAHLLPYYERYFDVKYPLPKLDLIAGPGASQFFEAMENWGAIFFFEQDLLIDSGADRSAQRDVYIDVAHEMSHQWFGDLVTMAWWDDLWLNEGFASWMEIKATDHFHPEWDLWTDAQNDKDEAMELDARRGTHPIIQPILDVIQANQAFDTITYLKGQAVVRMLESYVGGESFRNGVRAYIKAHAYGNTVSDDLWQALDQASGKRILDIAHDFTVQAGVPLIRIRPSASGLELAQDRFAEGDSGSGPTLWHVPVWVEPLSAAVAPSSSATGVQPWQGIVNGSMPREIPGNPGEGAVLNAGQAGYFRSLYSPELFKVLETRFAQLRSEDELGLIHDSYALGGAGYQPLTDFFLLLGQARSGMDPSVLRACAEKVAELDSLYQDLAAQAEFRAFARGVLHPIFAKLGWVGAEDERQNTSLLRETLLTTLSKIDDEEVIAEAHRRFATYLRDAATLSGDLRSSVLAIVAERADAKTWERLHTMARETDSSLEKQFLYRLLGSAVDASLARRALEVAVTDEAPVTIRPEIIASVAERHPELAFDFTLAHLDTIMESIEPDSRTIFVPQLVSHSFDVALIPRLRTYADAHIPATARASALQAEAQIAFHASIRTQRLPSVTGWLRLHFQPDKEIQHGLGHVFLGQDALVVRAREDDVGRPGRPAQLSKKVLLLLQPSVDVAAGCDGPLAVRLHRADHDARDGG